MRRTGVWCAGVWLLTAACGDDVAVIPDASASDARIDTRTRIGGVTLINSREAGMNSTLSVASFVLDGSTATMRDDGPCRVTQSTKGSVEAVSAGTVRIAGAAIGDVVLEPDTRNMYRVDSSTGFRYSPNEVLTISATGATVPSFSTNVTFPSPLTVTSPTSISVINRSSGVTATWSPTPDTVRITITRYPDSTDSESVICTYPGSAGTGTVPPSALTDLTPGSMGAANFLVSTSAVADEMTGEYELSVHARTSAFDHP